MAQYKIPDPEELVQCPYDKVHMVRAKRMQYHLMKCRKNYAGRDYATCPFNARHEMPKPELRYHIANCPDKAMIEPALSYEISKRNGESGTMFKGCTDVPAYDKNWNVPQSENWDEEVPAHPRIGVDPAYFMRLNYKDLTGLTRQEKKMYKEQMALPPDERKVVISSQTHEDEVVDDQRQLRLPHQVPQAYMGIHQPKQPLQQPSQVFLYSMSMAGVGRGQSVANGGVSQAEPSDGPPARFPGRGRGLGRGMLPPSMMQAVGNGAASNENPNIGASGPVGSINSLMMPQMTAAAPPVFTMGVGRGRGMLRGTLPEQKSEPSFIVPNVNKVISDVDNQANGTDSDEQGSGTPGSATAGFSEITEEDLQEAKMKNMKKIMKKLKQIEILEKKKLEGAILGSSEEMKIGKKDELSRQLQALQI